MTSGGGRGDARGMVLGAGLGSRLRPLTSHLPKPCVPFLNEPLLFRSLRILGDLGMEEVVVNTAYQSSVMERMCAAAPSGLPSVTLSVEEVRLGTGGGVANASPLFLHGSPIVLMNGDVVTDLDVGALLEAHLESGAWATLAVFEDERFPASLHKVQFDATGRVVELDRVRDSSLEGPGVSRGIYTGTLVMSPEFVASLPTHGGESCLKVDGFWPTLRRGGFLNVFQTKGYWSDIGTPARYLETHVESLEAGMKPGGEGYVERAHGMWVHESARIDSHALLDGPMVIGPDVVIDAHAVLRPGVCLGAGVHVREHTILEHVVAWDGTVIGESLQDAIVWNDGVHRV